MDSWSVKNGCLGSPREHLGLAAFERADERSGVLRRDLLVKRPLPVRGNLDVSALLMRIHLHQRALAAQLHAADAAHFHLVFQAGLFDRLLQGLFDALGVGRHAARRHAAADDMFLPRGAFLLGNLSSGRQCTMVDPSFHVFEGRLGRLPWGDRPVINHRRSDAARADAAGGQQRKFAVRRRFPGLDACLLLAPPPAPCRPLARSRRCPCTPRRCACLWA